ncbi:hypothetical protein HY385_02070 [Candidatus Daviesbacteria bacterium]|nr:hypothetical protein [Candidatus Daviesbacteria bacterium]
MGKVTHYFDKIGVAIIDLDKGKLKVGQEIKFQHGDKEFSQKIDSIQIEHKDVEEVKAGDSFGVKVDQPTKPGTLVYLV